MGLVNRQGPSHHLTEGSFFAQVIPIKILDFSYNVRIIGLKVSLCYYLGITIIRSLDSLTLKRSDHHTYPVSHIVAGFFYCASQMILLGFYTQNNIPPPLIKVFAKIHYLLFLVQFASFDLSIIFLVTFKTINT